ncbi:MAG: carboxynorspermidine decarboxylase [Clostridia bacterium]|nr:carboxynorspermidine decarboxylase [Clostridia bacterium]
MNLTDIKTPAYVLDKAKLIKNLEILRDVEQKSGAHILLAQKAFSMFAVYPLIGEYISGTTASGLYEAKLGYEEMHKENHVFSPAYKEDEIDEIASICDHVIFNSVAQVKKYAARICGKTSCGLRVNPEISTQEEHAIYDPCAPGSRLGVTRANLDKALATDPDCIKDIEGIHFHTLCEQNADDLETTLNGVIEKFGDIIAKMKWVNFGGGHHITRDDYDRDLLVKIVTEFKARFDVEVYLEPGEAIALNAGYLVTEVMDIVDNDIKILILDASAACHMPDVLEMPYRPPLRDSGKWGEKAYEYRLSSHTCLAGDIIGDYSFDKEIKVGDKLVFEDMAIYSMVKNNTFNGIGLPDIDILNEDGTVHVVKSFGYGDFKERLS